MHVKEYLSLVLSLAFVSDISYASDVYIKTGTSIGQGSLIEQDDSCYLVTPAHVIEGASQISVMTADRKSHEVEVEKVFDVDVALLKTRDMKACAFKQTEGKVRLKAILKIYRDGVLKSKLSDGSTLQTKVTVKGIDQSEYLQIVPRKSTEILKQGYSGSVLQISGVR